MDQPYLAFIAAFGFNFAPRGWAFCNGQIISIQQNTALFSLLGTTYGGNGQTNFALPDLRGRAPIGMGQGPSLSNRIQGEVFGTENVTMLSSQMPQHTHSLSANTGAGTTGVPTNAYLAASPKNGSGPNAVSLNTYTFNPSDTTLSPQTIGVAGNNQPMLIMQPCLAINYSIALQGIFPSRN